MTKITRDEVLAALKSTSGLPRRHGNILAPRMIYEAGDAQGRANGHFFMTYASYPGGTKEEIPQHIIVELEVAGLITRAYPDKPKINAWKLERNS